MKQQVVKFTAPKAGMTTEQEFTINQWPETLAEAIELWKGEKNCFDNLQSMAVQKAGNKARAMANPSKEGPGKSIDEIRKALADWKLGEITRAERAAFDPAKYIDNMNDPEKIAELLAKLKERQRALRG